MATDRGSALPEMAKRVELWPTSRLKPYASNPRTHSSEQIAKIAASIQEFGFTNPILVDAEAGILAGHGRLVAAQSLGLEQVPVIELTHLTPAQRRAYILADNRLALDAGWDDELLAQELSALAADGYDLSLTGFVEAELERLLGTGPQYGTDPDEIPPLPAVAASRLGDVWILGRHRVMCGDSTSLETGRHLMAGLQADCLWTDPPYNVAYEGAAGTIQNDDLSDEEFQGFLGRAFRTAHALLREGAAAYVAHADAGPMGVAFRRAFMESGFYLASCLVWRKNSLVLGRSDYHWQHEPILYGWKQGAAHAWFGARDKTTMLELPESPFQQVGENEWQICLGETTLIVRGRDLTVERAHGTVLFEEKPARNAEHPTMKPVALIQRMLANSTTARQCVLDLFGGSGSTLIACEQLGRSARLMELEPRFVDVTVRRWQSFTGNVATLEGDGRRFDEVASQPR